MMTTTKSTIRTINGKTSISKRPQSWSHTAMTIIITASVTWMIASFLHAPLSSSTTPVTTRLDHMTPPIDTMTNGIYKNSMTINKRVEEPPRDLSRAEKTPILEPYIGYSRAFEKFEHEFPCVQGEPALMKMTPAHEGILFQRPHKTGSTTMVGIVLRLAHNKAIGRDFQKCKHRAMHGTAMEMDYGRRDLTKSFLFSIIRDPTKRLISEFFHFEVTAFQKDPTDPQFLQKCRNAGHHYYLKELSTRNYTEPSPTPMLDFAKSKGYESVASLKVAMNSQQDGTRLLRRQWNSRLRFGTATSDEIIKDILDDYNFIAIMERMDESLVAFQMLFGLTTKEILYTRARSSGSFSNGWDHRPCFFIMKSFLTDGMKEYFASEEWQDTVQDDLELYRAANASLDRTIDALGREEFNANLKKLQDGLLLAKENCKGRIRTMCTDGGYVVPLLNRTCYIWAEGCDHACIDELEM